MFFLDWVKAKVYSLRHKYKWKRLNSHNQTIPRNNFPIQSVEVGKKTYGSLFVLMSAVDTVRLKIGNYCSIASEVAFILGSDHYTNHISSFPFKVIVCGAKREAISKGDIIIDDDVWIGYGSIILSGVHIGQGAIVAAGSVVTKDVPPYAIVGGSPAKVIRYRFDEKMIEKLMKIDYAKLDEKLIKEHIDDLYMVLNNDKMLEWLPQKS